MNDRIRLVMTLAVAVLVVFAVHSLEFPGSVPNFHRVSGGGVLLDVKPSFSEEATYERLSGYGEEGRKNYAFRNRTVDIFLPLAVFPALFLLMLRALKGFSLGRFPRAVLLALPFLYVMFDFAENATVLALLANFPERLSFLAQVAPYFTVVKRVASLLALVTPLVIFIVTLVHEKPAKAVA